VYTAAKSYPIQDLSVMPVFEEALKTLRKLGATIIDPADVPSAEQLLTTALDAEMFVLSVDFKVRLSIDVALNPFYMLTRYTDPAERLVYESKIESEWRSYSRATHRIQRCPSRLGRTSWLSEWL
jgi:hypothetical protein